MFLALVLLVAGAVSFLGWRQSIPAPRVTGTPPRLIGHKATATFVVEAAGGRLARAEVRVLQGGKSVVVARPEGALGRRAEVPATIEAAAAGLKEGGAAIEVWARDDVWRPLRLEDRALASYPVTIDLTPPRLDVVSATSYIAPGGAGLVVFRAGDAVRAGVRVGELAFPSFPVGTGEVPMRLAFFALPYDYAAGTPIAVTAEDEAGNVASRGVPSELLPRKFRHDRIEIKDAFLEAKVPELLPQRPPSQPLIEAFLVINRDLRRQAEEQKRRIGATTADKPMWAGTFEQPRNTKVFSNFAEVRTYVYQGREIDTQVHYGFDLASTKRSPVPAANAGRVAFTGPLTIYGNVVILDHGLGLMTLYAHLSTIAVKVGEAVTKGQELGRTGTTGLAVGDHLHYEVLVSGVSVTPVEWWDTKWIGDRISLPLKAAGLPEIAGAEAREPSTRPAATPPRRRRAR
ncbi:MAG: peptidoglycan DD-metalloendopeptidase family protein [Candidatus Rokubacteria bacterium]|nr:peptidoglycan DD-metalloendopeptidase family protein [Candidatus Rokubacteria bacterium]